MVLFFYAFALCECSHFRAGSINFSNGKNSDEIIVERSRSWRQEAAGFGTGCTVNDIEKKHISIDSGFYENGIEICSEIGTGHLCGTKNASYIVTDLEGNAETANNYCYGYSREIMSKEIG